jgi:hypothetical protein
MSLFTGERIHQHEWTSLPMPEDVIDRVHKLTTTSPTEIKFEDKYGNVIEDESDNDSDIEVGELGTTVITSNDNNHSGDTVEEGNKISHDDDDHSVDDNQAPTPIDLEQTNMLDDEQGDTMQT